MVSHLNPGRPTGPLTGLSVLELAGQGPGPFAGMLLADMGATVVKVDRVEQARAWNPDQVATAPMDRGKRSVAMNLRHPDSVAVILGLVERSDVLIDPFRPGVEALARALPSGSVVHLSKGCHTGSFFTSQEPASLAFLAHHLSA